MQIKLITQINLAQPLANNIQLMLMVKRLLGQQH